MYLTIWGGGKFSYKNVVQLQ